MVIIGEQERTVTQLAKFLFWISRGLVPPINYYFTVSNLENKIVEQNKLNISAFSFLFFI